MINTWVPVVCMTYTTLLESIRNRVLWVVVAFMVMLVVLAMAAASVSIGEQARLIVDVGMAITSIVGTVIAITSAITFMTRDIERRTIYALLVRPIRRSQLLLGRYFGLSFVLIFLTAIMFGVTAVTVVVFGGTLPVAYSIGFVTTCIELSLVLSVSLLFSSFTMPILAVIFSTGMIVGGHLSHDILNFSNRLQEKNVLLYGLLRIVYYILPDLQAVNVRIYAANQLPIPDGLLSHQFIYAAGYTICIILLTCFIFSRRRVL